MPDTRLEYLAAAAKPSAEWLQALDRWVVCQELRLNGWRARVWDCSRGPRGRHVDLAPAPGVNAWSSRFRKWSCDRGPFL